MNAKITPNRFFSPLTSSELNAMKKSAEEAPILTDTKFLEKTITKTASEKFSNRGEKMDEALGNYNKALINIPHFNLTSEGYKEIISESAK